MSGNKDHRVLVVDDSPQDIQMILEFLKDDYAVLAATSGEKAIDMAFSDPTPDVILMDVSMEGMDGYETCRQIKTKQDIDIIFVSANDSTDEILAGYDAGGIDYVTKPFVPYVLASKVELAIANRRQKLALKEESSQANQAAISALYSSGDLALVLNFLRTSFSFEDSQELAEGVAKAVSDFGIACSAQLRSKFGNVNVSSTGVASSLEEELLSRMQHQTERFVEHGNRLFINYENVTLFIKDMPVEDSEKCGRIKDNVSVLIEGANAKLEALDFALQLENAISNDIDQVLLESEETLQGIKDAQAEHKSTSMKIMDEMMKEVEDSFFELGLTESQEQKLLDILHRGVERSLNHFEAGTQLDAQLKSIIDKLSSISQSR